jgi:hypothetical protein
MQLKEYINRYCIIPSQMARKMKAYPNAIYRIMHHGTLPSLQIALRIEDFTDGKVTPRDIYNECIELKEKKKERDKKRQEKNSAQPKE